MTDGSLRTEFPQLRSAIDAGFSKVQAKAVVKQSRLGPQRTAFLRRLGQLHDELFALEAQPGWRQAQDRLARDLEALATHGDSRRTRVVKEQLRWPWGSRWAV